MNSIFKPLNKVSQSDLRKLSSYLKSKRSRKVHPASVIDDGPTDEQEARLSNKFEVTGLFYENNSYKCRKYLDIKRLGSLAIEPDLMVIMMNPGSSHPLDGIDNNSLDTKAQPETAHKQIMRVMDAASIDYARILSLSDLRTSNSSTLYKFIKSKESNSIDHSIFSQGRRVELNQLCVKNVPVIFAWGVNPALVPLAKQVVETLSVDAPLGLPKAKSQYSYYHPMPQIYEQKVEWVKHVSSQLISRRSTLGVKI